MEHIIIRKEIKLSFFLGVFIIIVSFLGTIYYSYTYIDYQRDIQALKEFSNKIYQSEKEILVAEWRFKQAFEQYGFRKQLLLQYIQFLKQKSALINNFYINADRVYYYNLLLNHYRIADESRFHKELGLLYYECFDKNYYPLAENYLKTYIKIKKNQQSEKVYFSLYQIYREKNQQEEMEKMARHLHKNFPTKVKYHLLLSKHLIHNKKNLEAKSLLRSVVYANKNATLNRSSEQLKEAGLMLMSLLSTLKLMDELKQTYKHLLALEEKSAYKQAYYRRWKNCLMTYRKAKKTQESIHQEKVGGLNGNGKSRSNI